MCEYVYRKIGVKCILQLNTLAEPEQQILARAQDALFLYDAELAL